MYQQNHYGAQQQSQGPAYGAQGQAPGQAQGQYPGVPPEYGYPGQGYPVHAGVYGAAPAPGGYPQAQTGFYPPAYAQAYPGAAGYPDPRYQAQTPFFNFSNERFIKGLVIGAAAAYLLTNESVQRGAIKGLVKVWSALQGGVAEIKERFHDAEAEIRAAEAGPGA